MSNTSGLYSEQFASRLRASRIQDTSFLVAPIRGHAFLSRRFSSVTGWQRTP
jgi:hypothetical protein